MSGVADVVADLGFEEAREYLTELLRGDDLQAFVEAEEVLMTDAGPELARAVLAGAR